MATLAKDAPRAYEAGIEPVHNDLPIIASDIIYEGAAVGDNGSGYARPFVVSDPFWGFAAAKCDNSASAVAGAKNVRVVQKGAIRLTVVGASSVADIGEAVYATDDATFTLTASGATQIGKVLRWVTSTTCIVYFESAILRSV